MCPALNSVCTPDFPVQDSRVPGSQVASTVSSLRGVGQTFYQLSYISG